MISASYRAAERQAVQAFALSVYSNPSAASEDRASAYERLLQGESGAFDPRLLTVEELRTYVLKMRELLPLYNKGRGEAVRVQRKPQPVGPGYRVAPHEPEPRRPIAVATIAELGDLDEDE